MSIKCDLCKLTGCREAVGYMTRSTAFRRIKEWMAEGRMKRIPGIDVYAPVPGNFGVSGGRITAFTLTTLVHRWIGGRFV